MFQIAGGIILAVMFLSLFWKIKRKANTVVFYLNILFVTSLLYLFNNIIFKEVTTGILQYFFICYFNDVLAPLWILSYSNILLSKKGIALVRLREIIYFTIFCGIVWEVFAPFAKKIAVTDIFDMVAYLFGGYLFWFLQRLYLKRAGKI